MPPTHRRPQSSPGNCRACLKQLTSARPSELGIYLPFLVLCELGLLAWSTPLSSLDPFSLYGVACLQSFQYFNSRRAGTDPLYLKALVYVSLSIFLTPSANMKAIRRYFSCQSSKNQLYHQHNECTNIQHYKHGTSGASYHDILHIHRYSPPRADSNSILQHLVRLPQFAVHNLT